MRGQPGRLCTFSNDSNRSNHRPGAPAGDRLEDLPKTATLAAICLQSGPIGPIQEGVSRHASDLNEDRAEYARTRRSRPNRSHPIGHGGETTSKKSAAVALALVTFLMLVATGEPRANTSCDQPLTSSQMICNPHFEELSSRADALPVDWSFAPGWDPPAGSDSAAYLLSDVSSVTSGGLKLIQGDDPVLIDSEVLVPIETGRAYRLKMNYRLDAIGDDPRGRITVEARYLDASGDQIRYAACSHDERISCSTDAECGPGNRCSETATAKATIASPYDPSVTGSWRQAERTLTLEPYVSDTTREIVEPRFAKIRLFLS